MILEVLSFLCLDVLDTYADNPSVRAIREHTDVVPDSFMFNFKFNFKEVGNEDEVSITISISPK